MSGRDTNYVALASLPFFFLMVLALAHRGGLPGDRHLAAGRSDRRRPEIMSRPIYFTREIREIEKAAGAPAAHGARGSRGGGACGRALHRQGRAGARRAGQQRRRCAHRRAAPEGEILPRGGCEPSKRDPGRRAALGPRHRRPVRHRPWAQHHRRARRAGGVRESAALPGARDRRAQRHPVRHRPGARLRGARHAHAHVHRIEAGAPHRRRPGPLRRGSSGRPRPRRPARSPAPGWPSASSFAPLLRPRPRSFHKGLAGSLGILGGARGMAGAALLAGRAALKLGAGRIYVGLLDAQGVDHGALELMLRHVDDVLGQDLDAVVAGPGLGRSEHAATLVGAVLAERLAVRARRRCAEPHRRGRGPAPCLRAAQRRYVDHPASGRGVAPPKSFGARRAGRPPRRRAGALAALQRARAPQGKRQRHRCARRPPFRQHDRPSRHGERRAWATCSRAFSAPFSRSA